MKEAIDFTDELKYLINNLSKMMLYYFSENILNLDLFADFKKTIEKNQNPNFIVFISQNLEVVSNDTVTLEDYSQLLTKKTWLNANTYYLLDLKTKVNPEPYKYLLDKYLVTLNNHLSASAVLVDKYEAYCVAKSDLLKNYLSMQEAIFNEHLQEINSTFSKPEINWETIEPAEISKPKLRDLISKGNPEKIEKIIIDHFKNSKNITMNRMFTALDKLGYIKIEYGTREYIIECLNNSINENKFKSKTVFINKIDVINDREYIDLRNKINNLIENLEHKK